MPLTPWEEIEHTADVALRVRGATLAELFANAARGMVALALGGAPAQMPEPRRVEVRLQAPDVETLLVDWLTELVYLMEEEAFIASEVEVIEVANNALRAEIRGGVGGALQRYIKAVTYHGLSVEEKEGSFQATIVFDV